MTIPEESWPGPDWGSFCGWMAMARGWGESEVCF